MSAFPEADTLDVLRGEETGPLLIEPMTKASLAMQVTDVITTDRSTYRVPKITEDPEASWVAEGEDIPEGELSAATVGTRPRKVAKIVFLPNELVDDSDPKAAEIVGRRLSAGAAVKVDQALFGIAPDEADPEYEDERPAGLEDVDEADLSLVDADTTDPDSYIDAVFEAEAVGVEITNWIMNPTTAKTLRKLKAATGSKVPLLNGRTIEDIPIRTSRFVTPGTVWGLPADRALTILRKDFEIASSQHAAFSRDKLAVRVIARVGFLLPSTKSIVKIRQVA